MHRCSLFIAALPRQVSPQPRLHRRHRHLRRGGSRPGWRRGAAQSRRIDDQRAKTLQNKNRGYETTVRACRRTTRSADLNAIKTIKDNDARLVEDFVLKPDKILLNHPHRLRRKYQE